MASGLDTPSLKIAGLDERRDAEIRDEVYRSIVKGYLDTGKGRKLRIMVVGEAGQGKSTLINALVGKEVAKEGDDLDAGTSEIKEYFFTQNGVRIGIWDTPGFGMESDEEDEKIVEQLRNSDCHPLDLTLFCIRMDNTRVPTHLHTKTIKKLTEVFDKNFWKHTLFVLTFANMVQELSRPKDVELEEFFSQRCEKIENKLRGVLYKLKVGLSDEELARVRAVPVGSCREGPYRSNPWALPDREDWFLFFWMDISEHMHSSALSALLQANYHRLEATSADDDTCSQTKSLCPPPSQLEPHERLLEATPEEFSEIKQGIKKLLYDTTALEDASINASIVSREGTGLEISPLPPSDCSVNASLVDKKISVLEKEETVVGKDSSGSVRYSCSSGNDSEKDSSSSGKDSSSFGKDSSNSGKDLAVQKETLAVQEETLAVQKETGNSGRDCSGKDSGSSKDSTSLPSPSPAIHDRKIPLYEILQNQLRKKNSGFFAYVKEFAQARGSEVNVFGHVGGFIEGTIAYLTRNKKKK